MKWIFTNNIYVCCEDSIGLQKMSELNQPGNEKMDRFWLEFMVDIFSVLLHVC